MTFTRYAIFRFAAAFGYNRRIVRMGDAASEMHLLKDAEALLGNKIWEKVEDIEELSVEYWSIRKLRKEHDRVATDLKTCQKELEKAHEERASLLGFDETPFQDLVDERRGILNELEDLALQRDEIVTKAREVRRTYDGIKMKIEVLEKEEADSTPEELEKNKKRVADLKAKFAELKKKRQIVGDKIAEGDEKVSEIEAKILEQKRERRGKASEAFQHIGDTNQKISNLNAELGVLDTQLRQLYTEIGRYVTLNYPNDNGCRNACKEHRGLVEVMAALRKSVQYNHQLAELSA